MTELGWILGETLVPWALGRAAGRVLPVRGPGRLLVLTLPPLALLAADAAARAVGAWDALTFGVALGVGWATAEVAGPTLARRIAQLALFAAVTHLAGRSVLPRPPEFVDEQAPDARFVEQDRYNERTCGLVAPEWDEGLAWSLTMRAHRPREPVTLHLGDSMLVFTTPDSAGMMTDEASRFPERLSAMDPVGDHVNLGTPGSSYDAMLAVARTARGRMATRRVVLHALMSNDLAELGRAHACCPGGSILDLDDPALPLACPDLATRREPWPALATLVRRSRPPLWLRAASRHDPVVGALRLRLSAVAGAWLPWSGWVDADDLSDRPGTAERNAAGLDLATRILARLRDELAAEHIDLVVVGLPVGPYLDPDRVPPDLRRRAEVARSQVDALAARCRGLGVRFLDAWPAFTPRDDADFLTDGHHLSRRGHDRLARWLGDRLDP